MDCVTNNNEFITKGDNFEIKQVEPSKKSVHAYQGFLAAIRDNRNIMEVALLSEERKEATEERQEEIDKKIVKLSSSVSDSQENMNKAFTTLIEGTLRGSFIESGYFRLDGADKEISVDLVDSLPEKLYEILKKNALSLIKVTEAIEGN
jgi:hypothetical protein